MISITNCYICVHFTLLLDIFYVDNGCISYSLLRAKLYVELYVNVISVHDSGAYLNVILVHGGGSASD